MRYYKRKWACAICQVVPLLDTKENVLTCVCGPCRAVPQYVQVSSYNYRKMLENFEGITTKEYERLKDEIEQFRKTL